MIQIAKIDPSQSYSDGRSCVYHIQFKQPLKQNELNALRSSATRGKSDEFELRNFAQSSVVLETGANVEPEQALKLLQDILSAINAPDESFKKKLEALNETLRQTA